MNNDKLLTPDEVAEMLGIPKNTLYSWRHFGRGPIATKVGRHLRYRESHLGTWIEGQTGAAENRPDPVISRAVRSNRNRR